jgi:hypothetical protein
MRLRSLGAIAIAVALAALGAGPVANVGSGAPQAGAVVRVGSGASDERDLPPSGRDALAKLFDAQLRPLGLRTTRASLQRRIQYGGRYRVGAHLAIYVEPIDPAGVSPRQSIETIVPLARIFLPKVFRRWSDLDSFDVCQEPPGDVDRSAAPPPLAQVAATRKGAAKLDWADVSLEDLMAKAVAAGGDNEYGLGDPDRLYLYVAAALAEDPAYRRARRAIGLPAATPTTTSTTRAGGSASG